MVSAIPFLGVFTAVLAVIYQFILQPRLYNTFGIGRPVVSRGLSGCQKLPEFEACEDGWYHQPSGKLYLSCASSLKSRQYWLPNGDLFNLEKRPDDDYIAIFDTKATGSVASRTIKVRPQGFTGSNGLGSYNLHGIAVHMVDDETIRIFVINHRPQPEPYKNGANSTIELFEMTLGSDTMQHIKTFADPIIFTPNNLVPTGPDSFIFSNDHCVKVGQMKLLDAIMARTNVAACDASGCRKVIEPYQYPNGIAGGTQFPNPNPNIVYIASSTSPTLSIMEIQADGSLVKVDEIKTNYSIDNINMDANGNIWAAGFPNLPKLLYYFKDPANRISPTVILKISKNKDHDQFFGQKYKVENIIEDDGSTLSGLTFAEYDTERELVFAGGVYTPYLAVCKVSI